MIMPPWLQRFNLAGQIPLLALLVLCLVTALLTNRFLSPLNLTNILVQSSIMAVIAIGMTFVIVGGGFDLSVGSTVAFAGCVAAMAMVQFGSVAGVVAGIAAGIAVGMVNGVIIAQLGVNPFRHAALARWCDRRHHDQRGRIEHGDDIGFHSEQRLEGQVGHDDKRGRSHENGSARCERQWDIRSDGYDCHGG